jgi:hypothetical protein
MKKFSRQLWADMIRHMNPFLLLPLAILSILLITDFNKSESFARLQTPVAIDSFTNFYSSQASSCFSLKNSTTISCDDKQLNEAARLNYNFLVNSVITGEAVQQAQSTVGQAKFVSHHLATGWGWILVFFALSFVTAVEIRQKSFGRVFLATSNWKRWFCIRWISIIAVCVLISALSYMALLISNLFSSHRPRISFLVRDDVPVIHQIVSKSRESVQWQSFGSTFFHVLIAILCVAAWAALALSLVMIFEHPAIGLSIYVGILTFFVLCHQKIQTFFPFAFISKALSLNATYALRDIRSWHVSGRPSFSGEPARNPNNWLLGLLFWFTTICFLTVTSVRLSQRRGLSN